LHHLDAAPLFLLIHALSLSRSRRTRAALHAFPSSLQALNKSEDHTSEHQSHRRN
jgi:ABC-type transporter Mla MlaB component